VAENKKTVELYNQHGTRITDPLEKVVWERAIKRCYRSSWVQDGTDWIAKVYASGELKTKKSEYFYDTYSVVRVSPKEAPPSCRGWDPGCPRCLGDARMVKTVAVKIHAAHINLCKLLADKLKKRSGLKGYRGNFAFIDIKGRTP
jgi:hypothetical protein